MILKSLPQVEFHEMEDAGSCCGLGGTYSVYHYDTSKKIGAKKASSITGSGAALVATDCPGCIMQLQDSINHAGESRERCISSIWLLKRYRKQIGGQVTEGRQVLIFCLTCCAQWSLR